MKFFSVCSGIEAASCAWESLGWEAVGFSEIEPFPCAVLAHRFPTVKNYGDMTKYKEWKDVEKFDVLVGGTPCQSFSVAGLRKGLNDPRGNLMLVYGAIADHFRPTWIVWENVPGVLSSNGGKDFGSFLGMLGELGYGVAYRVLDAQYFGVAQRRRRVFVVGYLGDWRRSAQVLFESESLSGNPAPSREKREGIARGVEIGPSGGFNTDIAPTLDTRCKDGPIRNQLGMAVYDMRGRGDGNTVPTLCTDHPSRPSGFCPVVMSTGQGNAEITEGHAPTLNCNHEAPIISYGIPGNWIGREPENGGNAVEPMHDVAPWLTKTDRHGVCVPFAETADCLTAAMGRNWNGNAPATNGSQFVSHESAVRRLTPRECERLQGFPDDWTRIPWRGAAAENCPDGPRYKACGNSMAVPVMNWIGGKIEESKNG